MAGLSIAAIRLLSRDPDRLAAFYAAAFGFERLDDENDRLRLRLGRERLEIGRTDGAPCPCDLASNDTRFQHFAIIVSDMARACAQLRSVEGWTAISAAGPETLPEASGGASAFKFRDPEGHPLELLQFSANRAPDPWASRRGVFLGIDHSAVGVLDTQRSVAFYEGLGFRVAARQVNRGREQARLDGLDEDPVVEVTALNPPGGAPPHLELLCYRRPPASAAPPAAPRDVAATRLVLAGLGEDVGDPDGHRLAKAAS